MTWLNFLCLLNHWFDIIDLYHQSKCWHYFTICCLIEIYNDVQWWKMIYNDVQSRIITITSFLSQKVALIIDSKLCDSVTVWQCDSVTVWQRDSCWCCLPQTSEKGSAAQLSWLADCVCNIEISFISIIPTLCTSSLLSPISSHINTEQKIIKSISQLFQVIHSQKKNIYYYN